MKRNTYRKLFDLNGRTAIVTGACGILGPRLAAALADFGAAVAVVDLAQDAADALAKELAATFDVRAVGVACDVADPDSVEAMIVTVTAALGPVHVLVNNAASKSQDVDTFFAPPEEYDLATWREISAVNLDGMFLVARSVGRHMLEHGAGGSIIQTASIYGVVAPDRRIYEGSEWQGRAINTPAVYSATKAGVIGLTRHLAAHWADGGIRVNALTPGGVQSGQNQAFVERYSARVPLGRMASPDELAGAVVYLASDASSYVTGQNIIVDGGLTSW